MNVAAVAGSVSTCLFMISVLPMLIKAWRTHDLASYSLGNLAISNLANLIHSVYVFSLPIGPIWLLQFCAIGALIPDNMAVELAVQTTVQRNFRAGMALEALKCPFPPSPASLLVWAASYEARC